MKLYESKPKGLLRLGFRLPIWLYRWKLGWLLGGRFLMLSHVGRKSGSIRQAVIEVVSHDKAMGTYYVVSGFGRKSDWFLNIQKNPNVKVTAGRHSFDAMAEIVPEEKASLTLHKYASLYPFAFKELSRILLGKAIDPSLENCRQFVNVLPMVCFAPEKI